MAETPEGAVASTSDSGGTPQNVPVRTVAEDARDPPPVAAASAPPQRGRSLTEQLQARQQELKEARCGLERERAQLERELERHHAKDGRERAMARDVHRQIDL